MSPCLVCGHGRWAHTSLSGCRTSGCTCTTFQPADSAPDPDLQQAIQAATQAILHARIWDNPTIDQEARIAVEAAWPQALEAAINQLRALLISNQAALGQVEQEGHPK